MSGTIDFAPAFPSQSADFALYNAMALVEALECDESEDPLVSGPVLT